MASSGRCDSVILDAADEAIYKPSRRISRDLSAMIVSPTIASTRGSMDSRLNNGLDTRPSSFTKAMFDSFRWMDEEQDLDLRLVLDNYHANLDGAVIPTAESIRRPSFRRHMSISKIPFGWSSVSSSNQTSPVQPSLQSLHTRRKSRTMSLMQPKHITSASISSIDPSATHYQDPEARLKLRVYLASPQKFDEAIEFGFPSKEGISTDKENIRPKQFSRDKDPAKSTLADMALTFLDDDNVSLSDDATMIDPDSPLTPTDPIFKSQQFRPALSSKSNQGSQDFAHLGIKRPVMHKHTEPYTHSLTGSREMTLRMTLTRPDLRADESALYGWQGARKKTPLGENIVLGNQTRVLSNSDIKGPFGGVDGWGSVERDDGMVKRFWNRVKSAQRKSS